jgi:cytochrome c-type biogenesis protein CcmE
MNPLRKQRLILIGILLSALGGATALGLLAFKDNINHFYSPSEVAEKNMRGAERQFRLGGVVLEKSLQREANSLRLRFIITDRFKETPVQYEGILPDLFREGQSVIATGKFNPSGEFVANEILAKHDESYMPPEVKAAIDKAAAKKLAQGSTP